MKILFITTKNPEKQGDYFEIAILNGLKKVLGKNIIDFPKKKIIYGDYKESPKNKLHGQGFTLLTNPFDDDINRNIFKQKFDAVIYGDGHIYGEKVYIPEIDKLANNNVWIIDGHDLYGNATYKTNYLGEEIIGNQFKNSFKSAIVFDEDGVYPTNLGIPEEHIRPLNLKNKNKFFQDTYPKFSLFENPSDLGGGSKHHKFNNEDEYFNDLSSSWFGLSCKRGSWDSLRNYEIIASGSLLLYRDYKDKPINCSPRNLPCISYSSINELYDTFSRLIVNNKPTKEYEFLLESQREWLINYGTTTAVAKNIIDIIVKNSNL